MPKHLAPTERLPVPTPFIERRIYFIRGRRVILDADIAELYQVPTKRLNEQVKRNLGRFPEDFMFRLTGNEAQELNRSQIATRSQKHRDPPPAALCLHRTRRCNAVFCAQQRTRRANEHLDCPHLC